MIKKLACYCYFFFLPFSVFGQKALFQFYTTQDGLSGSITHNNFQDRQGFIWLHNDFKLHRFDGRRFEIFSPPTNLAGSNEKLIAGKMYQDSLLISLGQKYLFSLNIETGYWQSYLLPSKSKLLRDWGIIAQSQDRVTIFEQSRNLDTLRLWSFNDGQFASSPIRQFVGSNYRSFLYSPNGTLYRYDGKDDLGNTIEIWKPGTNLPYRIKIDGLSNDAIIRHIYPLDNGGFSLLTYRLVTKTSFITYHRYKIYTYHPTSDKLNLHPLNRFITKSEIFMDKHQVSDNGDIWISGGNRNLYYFDKIQDTLFDFSPILESIIPNTNDIYEPFKDSNGLLWHGSQLGLLKVSLLDNAVQKYFYQPLDNCNGYCSFRGMTEDDQGNIFASFYSGVVRFDPDRQQPNTYFTNLEYPVPLPSSLQMDEDGLWLNNGTLLNPDTKVIHSIQGAKNGNATEEGFVEKDKYGRLWWVYLNELFYLDKNNDSLNWQKVLDLPSNRITETEALQIGKYSSHIYISHQGQLLQYHPKNQQQKWFTFDNIGSSQTRILAIEEDQKQHLWLATNYGLIHFNPTSEQSKIFTTKDGLPNNFICGMLTEGDSCLWLSTNHGLSRFSKSNNSFVNFFEEDGLSENEFNRKSYFKAKDGRLFFGGLKGLNAFYPDEFINRFRRQNESSQLSLSSFEYVDEKIDTTIQQYHFDFTPTIDIHYHHRSFTFEYVLTDYRNPSEITYSYRMEGYEDTWSAPSKFNFTRYSSLPSGQYTFQVKAKDSHGLWHPNQLAVKVIVHPPWWATWWAYLGYAILLLGIAFAIFSFLKKRWQLQNKLKQEQDEALRLKELDSFKTKLYTNLTHEFRTPLTVILGMTDQIKNKPDQYLEKGTQLIKSNGQSLLRLVNQLLDLSKLEDKSFKLNLEQADFVVYLRYITESFQTFANSHNISLRFFSTLESLQMDFDPEQIKQVMTNLISNAIKFTPSGGEVNVRLGSKENALAQITITDTGIGIPEADLPYIFDRFYQVDGSLTRQGEGTGIGLAHTQELVKLMEGNIEVESQEDKGTSFILQLPIRNNATKNTNLLEEKRFTESTQKVELQNQLNTSEHHTDYQKSSNDSDTPTLLIIEDNPDVVIYLKSCLEEIYQLEIAYNGRIGVEKALEKIPDLIISDVMMPEKDGLEVCDTLKNDERTSHIPIILLTAKADIASKIDGLRRGADAYLAKPFDKEELIVRLEKLAERQKRLIASLSLQHQNENTTLSVIETPLDEAVQVEDQFIKKVRNVIAENYENEDFGLPQLCQKIGMSRSQLYRKMKVLIDRSPSDFIRHYRLNEAKKLLETTEMNVSEVAWHVGFKDLTHFSRAYQSLFGFLPSATNKQL